MDNDMLTQFGMALLCLPFFVLIVGTLITKGSKVYFDSEWGKQNERRRGAIIEEQIYGKYQNDHHFTYGKKQPRERGYGYRSAKKSRTKTTYQKTTTENTCSFCGTSLKLDNRNCCINCGGNQSDY